MSEVWNKVMSFKNNDDMHKGIANTLDENDRQTIYGTIDFFGGRFQQDIFDLKVAKYRVFDWLAMRIQGRHSGSVHDIQATKVLAHSFIKSEGVVSKFIQDLRETDYEVDTSWENIKLEDEVET